MAHDVGDLARLFAGRRIVALTGAGVSTESGIPDYRGPETRRRARAPMDGRLFARDDATRRRYWARSFAAYARFSAARPNGAHDALAAMERAGTLAGVITQNVDRLHHAAGSARVIELHGAIAEVRCIACGAREPRADVQRRLAARNPAFEGRRAALAPDGDADLPDELVESFEAVPCATCGDGVIRPDVVFFGEAVDRARVEQAYAWLDAAGALLVAGTSLAVFSGYRFLRRAVERRIPVGVVNLGELRGGESADVHVDARAGDVLPALAARLGG